MNLGALVAAGHTDIIVWKLLIRFRLLFIILLLIVSLFFLRELMFAGLALRFG